MSDYTTSTSGDAQSTTVTAFFDSYADATDAVQALRDAGVTSSEIRMTPDSEQSTNATTDTGESHGFFGMLADFFMPDEDRHTYAEGLRRGGYMVAVTSSSVDQDTIYDILEERGSVDLDARESEWRNEGWTGSRSTTDDLTAGAALGDDVGVLGGLGTTGTLTTPTSTSTTSYNETTSSAFAAGTTSTGLGRTDEEVIPIVEEELRVGKRDVAHGRVKIRSYVVERPVSEDVSLRSERVTLDRRPVDRAVSGDDVAFQERTIEAEERAEEAVISKTARVTEEVSLRKDVQDRTETVSDTVRKTEVEIEDERVEGVNGVNGTLGDTRR